MFPFIFVEMRKAPRNASLLVLSILGAALSLQITGQAEDADGLVIYKNHPKDPAHLSYAMEFQKVEHHSLNVNITPIGDGSMRRFMKDQIVTMIDYNDLSGGALVDENLKRKIYREREALASLANTYPSAAGTISRRLKVVDPIIQMLDQGLVRYGGRWIPIEDLPTSFGKSADTGDKPHGRNISVGGRVYQTPRLAGYEEGVVRIMHSGGVASLDVNIISKADIEFLNQTSTVYKIEDRSSKSSGRMVAKEIDSEEMITSDGVNGGALHETSIISTFESGEYIRNVRSVLSEVAGLLVPTADENWDSFPKELEEQINQLVDQGEELARSNREGSSIRGCSDFVAAVGIYQTAAEVWEEGNGIEAYRIYKKIEFPPAFSATNEFAKSWKLMAALMGDLTGKHDEFMRMSLSIKEAMRSESKTSTDLAKEVDAALQVFPSRELENIRATLKKNSLGL